MGLSSTWIVFRKISFYIYVLPALALHMSYQFVGLCQTIYGHCHIHYIQPLSVPQQTSGRVVTINTRCWGNYTAKVVQFIFWQFATRSFKITSIILTCPFVYLSGHYNKNTLVQTTRHSRLSTFTTFFRSISVLTSVCVINVSHTQQNIF